MEEFNIEEYIKMCRVLPDLNKEEYIPLEVKKVMYSLLKEIE